MEWKINKSQCVCTGCNREMAEEERYVSALFWEEAILMRRDFCDGCWGTEHPRIFSYWRTRVPKNETARRPAIDTVVLLELFERIEAETERSKLNFRYLLGLILLRKKILKLTETRFQDGGEYLIMVTPKQGRVHTVFNPRMTDEEVDAVQAQLAQVFETDFRAEV